MKKKVLMGYIKTKEDFIKLGKVMKANAPEKIYLHKKDIGTDFLICPIDNTDIEYTRTDAFIEKAEEFIYSALNDGIMGTANIEDFMRLFRKYMKGE